jgi:hypothetical protein
MSVKDVKIGDLVQVDDNYGIVLKVTDPKVFETYWSEYPNTKGLFHFTVYNFQKKIIHTIWNDNKNVTKITKD